LYSSHIKGRSHYSKILSNEKQLITGLVSIKKRNLRGNIYSDCVELWFWNLKFINPENTCQFLII